MKIDDVNFHTDIEEMTNAEAWRYVEYVRKHANIEGELESVEVTACEDGKVDVSYSYRGRKFERIRRITGYLTGTLDTWNDSKRAEERERVKHGTERFKKFSLDVKK